jgi:hypothetical protein
MRKLSLILFVLLVIPVFAGSSPVLRSAIVSPLASGAGHVAGGTTANLFDGQSFGDAFANSCEGIGKSMVIGGGVGIITTIGVSYANKISPLSGKSTNFNGIDPAIEETKLLQRYNSVESVIEDAGKLERLKGGVRQGFVQGNADDIFKGLSQQYGTKIQIDPTKGHSFFTSGNVRVDLTGSSQGISTLRINNSGQIYKIRIK